MKLHVQDASTCSLPKITLLPRLTPAAYNRASLLAAVSHLYLGKYWDGHVGSWPSCCSDKHQFILLPGKIAVIFQGLLQVLMGDLYVLTPYCWKMAAVMTLSRSHIGQVRATGFKRVWQSMSFLYNLSPNLLLMSELLDPFSWMTFWLV